MALVVLSWLPLRISLEGIFRSKMFERDLARLTPAFVATRR